MILARFILRGLAWGSTVPQSSSAPSEISVVGHLEWKYTECILVLHQNGLFQHMSDKIFSGDQLPFGDPWCPEGKDARNARVLADVCNQNVSLTESLLYKNIAHYSVNTLEAKS